MIGGCVLIVIGLLYAFYGKPLIIRHMKQKAIAKASADAERRARIVREDRVPAEAGV